MSQKFFIKNQFSGGGITANNNRELDADGSINNSEAITAGVAGTAGAAGVMTMPTGHGFQNSDKVCVSGAFGAYYDGSVSQAGANAITVSGGAGDTLPVTGAVVVAKQTEIDIGLDGSNLVALSVSAGPVPALITLETEDTVVFVKSILANGAYQWDSGNGETNPITGDVIVVAHAYNLGTVAGEALIVAGYNND